MAESNTTNEPKAVQPQVIEPPTDSNNEPTLELNPGENISFDAMEQVEAAAERKKQLDVQEEADKQQAIEKEKGEEKPEATPKEEEKDGKDDEKKTEASTETKTETTKTKDESVQVKTIKAKVGDNEIDLRFDTKVPVKIDGVEKFATIDQLTQNFSGLGHLHTKFNELKTQKNEFESEINTINQTINEINELAKTDSEAAMTRMVEAIGGDSYKVVEEFKQSVIETAEKLADMSLEEREVFLAKSEADRYKKLHESTLHRQKDVEERKALDTEVRGLQEAHGIDDVAFNDKAEELLARKQRGEITESITTNVIINEVLVDRMYDSAGNIIKEILPEKASDHKFTDEIVQVMAQNNFGKPNGLTEAELKEIVAESFGVKSTSQSLSEKVRDAQAVSTGDRQNTAREPQNDDVWNFDQLI